MLSSAERMVRRRVPAAGGPRVATAAELTTSASGRRNRPGIGRTACRTLNVVVAALALVLTLPLLLLIGVVVAATSRGPIIFTQMRVGIDRREPDTGTNGRRRTNHGGRLFRMYKFRTMRADANGESQIWAHPNDQRVTPVGRVLRKYRLDELPQLLNVLKGEMNVVGPRPEQPLIFASLNDQIAEYGQRQRVLPGITGWAQINQPYDQCVDDVRRKLAYDLEYIERRTPLHDLAILVRTLPVIIAKRGAW